jgi:hypothetical protein
VIGAPGVAHAGDGLGPHDGAVRTYDIVAVRMSCDVLDTSAEGLTLTAAWTPSGSGPGTRSDACPSPAVRRGHGSAR